MMQVTVAFCSSVEVPKKGRNRNKGWTVGLFDSSTLPTLLCKSSNGLENSVRYDET